MHPSDEDLAAEARQSPARAREAVELLYQRHSGALFGFLRRMTNDSHLAEDLLQETFLRAHGNLARFRPERRLVDWLYTIALNAARDAIARRRTAAVPSGRLEVPVADRPGQRDEQERLDRLIAELPPEEREAFVLAKVEGRKLQDVADLLECSLRTVKYRLAAAIERLARLMTREGEP